jgi:hypothetical protein
MNFRTLLTAIILSVVASTKLLAVVTINHGGLEITLPENPIEDTVTIGGNDGFEPSLQHRLIVNRPDGTIIVWYQDAPNTSDPEPSLLAARDSIVRLAGGPVSVDKRTAVHNVKHPGRAIIASIPEKRGEVRMAIYFVSGRFYQVMVVGTHEFTNSEAAKTVFTTMKFGS